ncbi:MAG TPA: T9SS type A sorting domain-containing protein [Bacteroidia bacterium]|nr:T9SS type A sorting domain-containing protein [Bacteroidia bacterium]
MKKIYMIRMLLFALLFTTGAGAQTISTFAGNGITGDIGDSGQATSAEMNQPWFMAKDASGNIYISEGNGCVIRKVAPSGIITTIAGTATPGYSGDGGQATAAQLNAPAGMAFDASGNLLFADFANNVIRKIDMATGIITTIAGTGTAGYSGDGGPASAAQFHLPRDVRFDATGNLYVCDWLNHVIRKIDLLGNISTIAGTGTTGYSGDGGQATAALISLPYKLVIDTAGNLFFIDGSNNCVREINTSGIISTVVGTGTSGFSGDGGLATAAQLNIPTSLAFDSIGDLYIADRGNARIRMVSTAGIISTVVGNGTVGDTGDGGPAISAEITTPFDLLFDDSSNLYIAEINSSFIRKVTRNPLLGTEQHSTANNNFVLYPDPNNGVFRINVSLNSVADENASIEVTDVLGQVVFENNSTIHSGKLNAQINLDNDLPSGIYFLRLKSSAGIITSRFVIGQ